MYKHFNVHIYSYYHILDLTLHFNSKDNKIQKMSIYYCDTYVVINFIKSSIAEI